jgi:hypothetical protein
MLMRVLSCLMWNVVARVEVVVSVCVVVACVAVVVKAVDVYVWIAVGVSFVVRVVRKAYVLVVVCVVGVV